MFKSGSECFQSIINSLRFGFGEVTIRLDFPLDVLKFGFQLLFGLNSLHEHHIVVTVHLDKLVVHVFQGLVVVLHAREGCHILLDELLFDLGHRFVVQILFRPRRNLLLTSIHHFLGSYLVFLSLWVRGFLLCNEKVGLCVM